METLVLLARDQPLPQEVNLARLLADLPRQQMRSPQALLWFTDGKPTAGRDRAFSFDATKIDDPLLEAQRRVQEALGPYFKLNRAVSFASEGGTP
jgi:hypothetical protein